MTPLSHLETMLSEYQPVFKYYANFNHFRAYVKGLINTPHRGTMTQIYLSTQPATTYWPLPKFLSRPKWCVDELTSVLTRQVQTTFSKGVYPMMKPILSVRVFVNMAHISLEITGITNATRTNPSSITDTSSVLSDGSVKPLKECACFRWQPG